MSKITTLFVCLSLLVLLMVLPASALEYQWKFFIPSLRTPQAAVRLFTLLNTIQGVYDVDINQQDHWVMFFFDDEYTDEVTVQSVLKKNGFPVKRMMLLMEPREGLMN